VEFEIMKENWIIKIQQNDKARLEISDTQIASSWFKNQDTLLQHIGRLALLYGEQWENKMKWRKLK